MTWQATPGGAWRNYGESRRSLAWSGATRQARLGPAWCVTVWRGGAASGAVWPGESWQARQVRRHEVWSALARCGMAWQAGFGEIRHGAAFLVWARYGVAR